MEQPSHRSADSIEGPIADLIFRLSTAQASAAWSEFLRRYSSLIMQVARRFSGGSEQASECFLFACEHLSDNGFRRLKSFRPGGPARFQTWLRAVVANLCIDWKRKQHGRIRPFAAVSGLSPLDRQVYRHIFLRGMTRNECQRALAAQFPDVTLEQVSEANARLFGMLSSRQRWQLTHRSRGSISFEDATFLDDDGAILQPEDTDPGPEQLASEWKSRDAINEALLKLLPRQRLLLRLRYQQDLTLEEVARLVGLPDPYRANREIQAAVEALAKHLPRDEP